MVDIKIEYQFYIDRKYLQKIKYLNENYNETDNVVQIILLSSQGVKSPSSYDFKLFLECYDDIHTNDRKSFLNAQAPKVLSRLLICACILDEKEMTEQLVSRLSKNLSLESLVKILMICIQYEQQQYSLYFYQLFVEYFQYESGVLREISNPQLQEIIYNLNSSQIKLLTDDIFVLTTPKHEYKIDSIFFKAMLKTQELRKKKFFLPLQKYQFFKNLRKKENEHTKDNTYPHTFQLRDELEGKVHIVAHQESAHSEILIFENQQSIYVKFSPEYLGSIERNYWGTSFQVYDYGYPEELITMFPKYFGVARKLLVQITYETNIMASQPRRFTSSMLNYVNNDTMELKQLEPVYNADKDCYQLNFYGRAKKASARNFEMIDPFDNNIIYLLHGKWEKHLFNLDYRYPMTMFQAFSFSLIAISKKFLVA